MPFVPIIVLSTVFIYKMNNKRSKFDNNNLSAARARLEAAFRRMVIALILSFSVVETLAAIMIHIGVSRGLGWAYNWGDGLLIIQSSINLLFYIISGPVFRNALKEVIMCR
ncbi:uncharacterized protein LOC142349379 [Convolutriloba macropyga]|uniref:uncharacterized protein LOC142349379 n=1 Tax=Convolutriloba macropyga TaxID=536237 RepID=UPI003F5218DA